MRGLSAGLLVTAATLAAAALPAARQVPPREPLLAESPLDPKWTAALGDALAAPPAYDAAAAYLPLRGGRLVAVALDDGAVRWSYPIAGHAEPAAGDGLVFAASTDAIVALERATGSRRWDRSLPEPPAAPLYWDTGWLIVSLAGGDLLALRASDGALVWRAALGASLSAAPAPALDRLYLGLADGRVVAADLASGREVWTRRIDGPASGLAASGDRLFVGTAARTLVSLDVRTGRQHWRWRLGGAVQGAPAADERRVYVATLDNVLRAFDRGRGHLRWRQGLPARPAAGPVLLDGRVVVPLLAAALHAFDAQSGQPVFQMAAAGEPGARPHLRRGGRTTGARLVAVTLDGRVQAFGPRVEPLPAPLGMLPGAEIAGEAAPPPKPPGEPSDAAPARRLASTLRPPHGRAVARKPRRHPLTRSGAARRPRSSTPTGDSPRGELPRSVHDRPVLHAPVAGRPHGHGGLGRLLPRHDVVRPPALVPAGTASQPMAPHGLVSAATRCRPATRPARRPAPAGGAMACVAGSPGTGAGRPSPP